MNSLCVLSHGYGRVGGSASSAGAYPCFHGHESLMLGGLNHSCYSLSQTDLNSTLDYAMPSAQDTLGYATWNAIQRKKDRYQQLDSLFAAGNVNAAGQLDTMRDPILIAPDSLAIPGPESSPLIERSFLDSRLFGGITTGGDHLLESNGGRSFDQLDRLVEEGNVRNEPIIFRQSVEQSTDSMYMGISLPEELDQLFSLRDEDEPNREPTPEEELEIKPVQNHPNGWSLHTEQRCLVCRSRYLSQLRSEEASSSEQRHSRMSGRDKLSPFMKLQMHQNAEGKNWTT